MDLILVRHGESEWNLANRFTGWTDVDLSERGRAEAKRSGELLRDGGYDFSFAFTSVLKRAIRTLWTVMDEMDRMWVPQFPAWQLNERHYGGLQGLNKAETAEKFSKEQVHTWRRSYDTPPPDLDPDDERHPRFDPRYRNLTPDQLPGTESLKLTLDRVMPYWEASIKPHLLAGENLIIAAHGNSLRALCKHLLEIGDADITGLEIPTGNPLILKLNEGLAVQDAFYLDTERAVTIPGR